VEDEPQVAGLARRVLGRAGYRVLEARDGVLGVELFARHAAEIDLVLLDHTLPRLSGLDALQEILRVKPGVRVIISSGDRFELPDGLPPTLRFLPKPYAPRDLADAVRAALE